MFDPWVAADAAGQCIAARSGRPSGWRQVSGAQFLLSNAIFMDFHAF
jgi:hypothetical protein